MGHKAVLGGNFRGQRHSIKINPFKQKKSISFLGNAGLPVICAV
jgi:hypothetical protein